MQSAPYDLTKDRRRMERRLSPEAAPASFQRQGALIIERRRNERRLNQRPLDEFPWLPYNC